MGGNSRSHKKRSRANRKKTKNTSNPTVSTDGETMVEPPSLLERVQTNYRVESPETVSKKTNSSKKPNGGTVTKSKSLDDDDLLKITELSEASEGEDNKSAECSAVVSEADSDVDWEKTEEIKSEGVGECLSSMSLPLEEFDTVQVTLISPEDEKNLRNFLEGLKLTTGPEEGGCAATTSQGEKKENYKERKARKRAAIAEHFMPVLQFPRFLDVIREEGDNNENIPYYSTDKYHFIKSQEFVRRDEQSIQKKMESHFPKSESEKVLVVGGKLTETANVEGTCSTSIVEASNSGPEVVFISSETSEDEDENAGKIMELTPPPTPDLSTPKNETIVGGMKVKEEDVFNKEFKGFCEELNLQDPCKYVNAVSPSRSPSVSSEGSSKTNSQCTARYNPMCSSIADVADLCEENLKEGGVTDVETLRELCLKELMSLPFGAEMLEELAEVSQSIQDLTKIITPPMMSRKNCPTPAFMSKKIINDDTNSSFNLPANKEEMSFKRANVNLRDEAGGKLLELQERFIKTREEEVDQDLFKNSNRLLAIIRESSAPQHRKKETHNLEKLESKMQEWLREKSASVPNLELSTYQSKNEVPSSPPSTNIPIRRSSLPQEVHQRQINYIHEKEKELQAEIEKLEKEKRKVLSEMAEEKLSKGEEAPTEIFRQKMYDEYMRKVAAREERKLHKVIKITSSRTTEELTTENLCEVTHASDIEDEFMNKVKERMLKYGLKRDDSEEPEKTSPSEDLSEPILVMDGDSLKAAQKLPKHLQEFIDMTRRAADTSEPSEEEMSDGVWSPGQRPAEFKSKENINESQEHKKKNEPPAPPVWTPRSAGSSPTVERKEFRPVNFESPVLGRKNKPKAEGPVGTPVSPSIHPPWQAPDGSSDVGVALSSSLERRIPTSHSAPASGFTEFSTPRLPRAQNPTITLLQKAREGQLPRGASYIQADSTYSYRSYDDRPPTLGPGEVLYQIKNEYTSESDSERLRKMADLGPRKYEIGIGPTTIDGMPLVLRSEVRDGNQSRWYKRMYDTIHKQKPPRDYVTVRYKQRRARYPYASGYFSEPEHSAFSADYYDSDGTVSDSKYATLDRRRIQPGVDKENDYMSAIPTDRDATNGDVIRHGQDVYKNQPGRIENYLPGRSSISEKEAKEWWDEVMDIFDGHLEQQKNVPQPRGYMSQALKESGYESDSTLVFRRREDAIQQLSPSEQREAYKTIQKGGDVPLHGLRKLAPERPKESEAPTPPPKGHHGLDFFETESPRKYVENEVTIHYKSPIRQEVKESLSEEELARRQAEHMKRVYEEERRRKYLQELQDMNNRRHTDNFTPSQKSPIPLNRYDDFPTEDSPKIKPRPRSPELRLVARALYNFVGQSFRELTFRKGDVIYVRRQVDKNWYEGEHNAMIGLFPANYVEIIPYDGLKSTPRKGHEGQARAKFNFIAQTHLELSLAKGELVVVTRRVDDNWFEGRIGGRKGIFPVSYVEVLIDPGTPPPPTPVSGKPVASPAAHSMLVNGSAGGKESMGSHSYLPSIPQQQQFTSSYSAKPVQIGSGGNYGSLTKSASNLKNPLNEVLHIDTHSEPVPYRALYKYRPQNDDELELLEGDVVYVLEKCDDGWYVGSSQRTGAFGTFPGNYVERI